MIGRINVKSKQKCLLKLVLSPLYSKTMLLFLSNATISISVGNFCVLIIIFQFYFPHSSPEIFTPMFRNLKHFLRVETKYACGTVV